MNTLDIKTVTDIIPATDSLNKVQSEIAAVAEKIASTPAEILIGDLVDKAVGFGLKLLGAFVIYFVGVWLIRKTKLILKRIFEKRHADAAIASFVQSLTSIAMTILLIVITVGTLGIDTTSLAALLAGGGMAIGMALNGTVQNFAGGIMILVFRPFKAGDFIEAQGFAGTVAEVNITSTKLTTTDNRVIIIPNGILSNGTINNYSDKPLRRLDLSVNVEYGSSAEQTKSILMELIEEDGRALSTADGAPADPFVALSSLNDSAVQFIVRLWVRSEDYWDTNFTLMEKIYNALPERGIKFPYTKLDVNIYRQED